jgi:hypothetical protein
MLGHRRRGERYPALDRVADAGRARTAGWRGRAGSWLSLRVGRWDCRLRPHRRQAWSGPFNGQVFRQHLFAELMARIRFVAIVETGTHHGTTTAHFRRATDLPIHSFEADPRAYGFATERLKGLANLHLHLGDSRLGLLRIAAARALPVGPVFFYLDAHWLDELPLAEEIALAFRYWPDAVVMVDDFAVPDDPGYGFDDYGPTQALTLAYLVDHGVLPTGVWFPRCVASAETGSRRGSVLLAHAADIVRQVDALPTLRRWATADRGAAAP